MDSYPFHPYPGFSQFARTPLVNANPWTAMDFSPPHTFNTFMPAGLERPKIFQGRDPTFHGVTNYRYRTPNGVVPNEGRTPGTMHSTPPVAPPFMLPQPIPGMFLGQAMYQYSTPFQTAPFPPKPASSPPRPAYQGQYTVTYFEDNFLRHHPPSSDGIVSIPQYGFTRKRKQQAFDGNTYIKDVIRGIDCVGRANHHHPYPEYAIGIQELLELKDGRFALGTKIYLTDDQANHTLNNMWPREGSGPKEILVVRLPV